MAFFVRFSIRLLFAPKSVTVRLFRTDAVLTARGRRSLARGPNSSRGRFQTALALAAFLVSRSAGVTG